VERYDGDSPACVLIHGGGDGAFIWDSFAPVLARQFTTIAVDLRGHGGSGWDRSRHYEMNGYVSDLAHVVNRSDLDQLVLIGHSLGAHIAAYLCERYASRVIACVLVDYAPELNAEGIQQAKSLLRESLQFYPTPDQYLAWLKGTRHLADSETLGRIAARSVKRVGDGFRPKLDPAFVDAFPEFRPEEGQVLWSLLKQQTCPTLVVRGAGSAVLSHATAKRLAEVLPRGELATVNAAGHSVMLDNPVEFERVVLNFLTRVLAER